MHKIVLHRNAVKFYRKADDALKERVTDAIDVSIIESFELLRKFSESSFLRKQESFQYFLDPGFRRGIIQSSLIMKSWP
jgi:hypothetical protein